MDKQEIDNVVIDIMIKDGPDRHIDGHEVITDFIMAVKAGKEYEWMENYNSKKD